MGSIDGKHISVKCPDRTDSHYFSYLQKYSFVLLAIVDYDSKFICIDVGGYGKNSNGLYFLDDRCELRGQIVHAASDRCSRYHRGLFAASCAGISFQCAFSHSITCAASDRDRCCDRNRDRHRVSLRDTLWIGFLLTFPNLRYAYQRMTICTTNGSASSRRHQCLIK
nr:unnamed protein product [Callosobruchus chinensis]